METSLIEQLDKSRYNLSKGLALGWAMWYGGYIAKGLIGNSLIIKLIILVGFIGWILFTINLIKSFKLNKKINADSRLKEALNNEMHYLYKLKSAFWGFGFILVTLVIFNFILTFYPVPAVFICQITIFTGTVSTLVATLIYNKE
jgi:hypothetical protein